MFAWTTWSKIRDSVLRFEDLDLFDWNNWVSQENKVRKCETIIDIVTLSETSVFFPSTFYFQMNNIFLRRFLFSFNICFVCSSLFLFPFICHHWQLRENVCLLSVFSAESAFGSKRAEGRKTLWNHSRNIWKSPEFSLILEMDGRPLPHLASDFWILNSRVCFCPTVCLFLIWQLLRLRDKCI